MGGSSWSVDRNIHLMVRWMVRSSPCSGNYVIVSEKVARGLLADANELYSNEDVSSFVTSSSSGAAKDLKKSFFSVSCDDQTIDLGNNLGEFFRSFHFVSLSLLFHLFRTLFFQLFLNPDFLLVN